MRIRATTLKPVPVGRIGENKYIEVAFPVGELLDQYPGASFVLLNKLPGEKIAYPVPEVAQEGTDAIWTVTDRDLTKEGYGECELVFYKDEVVVKDVIYTTSVKRALDGSGPVPDGWESWQQVFATMKADSETAAQSAGQSATQAAGSAASAAQSAEEAAELKSAIDELRRKRVASLDSTPLAVGTVIEAVGEPVYVRDVTPYSAYGITEKGWYVFARISVPEGVTVTNATTITGAAGQIVTVGAAYVDVAVRFGVTAQSQTVAIDWGESAESFVFKAGDLAVRNLDYRTTFYLYDLDEFVTWEYALTTDTAFVANKVYYTKDGDAYTPAEVMTGETIPAYYTLADETYTQATGVFEAGVIYYTKSGDTYAEAAVTVGDSIPAYYNHSKVTFSGMTRNVTYKLDTMIDCPIEIVLPEVDDEGYGAWYEFQLRYFGSHSCTLLPPTGIKVGTVNTQAQTAGVNVIDLQYTGVSGVKMWSLLNTHSNIPT